MNVRRAHLIVAWLCLLLLGGFCLFAFGNSFRFPYSPDCSVYTLHARTLLETGNRYVFSHESKGFLFAVMMSLFVAVFGTGQFAAAMTVLVLYLAAAWLLFRFLWKAVGPLSGGVVAVTWLAVSTCPLFWGGRTRPEDFLILLLAGLLHAAPRARAKPWVVAGCLMAVAALCKVSFVIAPALMIVAAWLFGSGKTWKQRVHQVVWVAAGAVLVVGLALIWIVAFDNFGGWYRQNIEWPAQYKVELTQSEVMQARKVNVRDLLGNGGLSWIFLGGVGGLIFGYSRGARRETLLLGAWVVGEFVRVIVELAMWQYLVQSMLPALLAGCAFWGLRRREAGAEGGEGAPRETPLGWVLALLFLAVPTTPSALSVLQASWSGHYQAFQRRVLYKERAPMEALVEQMRRHYVHGETMFVASNNYYPILALDAPRPYYILPVLLPYVSAAERSEAIAHFYRHPPDWIIASNQAESPVPHRVEGGVDDLYYSYFVDRTRPAQPDERLFHVGDRYVAPPDGPKNLIEDLLRQQPYQLVVDIGMYQAWKRLEIIRSD